MEDDAPLARKREGSDPEVAARLNSVLDLLTLQKSEESDRKIRRVKQWSAVMAAAASAAAAFLMWVFGQGQVAQAAVNRETQQDAAIQTTKTVLHNHLESATERDREWLRKLSNLGALQLEQGDDQRNILLQSAPKKVRKAHKKKPADLVTAEGAVRRD